MSMPLVGLLMRESSLNSATENGSIKYVLLNKRGKFMHNRKFIFISVMATFIISVFICSGFLIYNSIKNPIIVTIHPNFVIDIYNTPELVGFSDNVFLGKVIAKKGSKSIGSIPETQYKVEVIQNIKGNLNGVVEINQQGGHKWNKLILMEGDKLLEAGNTYLFVTRYLQTENWHTLVPKRGDILISSEKARVEFIDEFTKAYKEEIPFRLK
jgi:hypothetical protein